ncbi:MAG: hypothetical protein MUP63_02660 [Candidatus Nanohaloarchaeota archaeon QJJ-7]|nr:hypothetical protein [Candidatus Nanohaloarchaeota archaeon QJJ-7]
MEEVQETGRPEWVERVEAMEANDILVLDLEGASQILTDNRIEMMDVIEEQEPESIRDLARKVDRNVNAVMRDLKVLYENDVVMFEEEKNRKIPRMRHERVIVEPVV